MGSHLIDGEFQSDKYPTTPRGNVPLSVKDATAQDLLWAYAQRRRVVDAEFSDDLELALRTAGYSPPVEPMTTEELVAMAMWHERCHPNVPNDVAIANWRQLDDSSRNYWLCGARNMLAAVARAEVK